MVILSRPLLLIASAIPPMMANGKDRRRMSLPVVPVAEKEYRTLEVMINEERKKAVNPESDFVPPQTLNFPYGKCFPA